MNVRTTARTKTYFQWAANPKNFSSMESALPGGGYVDVRGRRIDSGEVQLFIGVYTAEGKPVHEEYQEDVKGLTIEQAINDGVKRGQKIAAETTS